MAEVASFGDLVFEVTENKILTYNDYTRTTEPRYIEHNILQNKPKLEFEGPGADPISFNVLLRAEFGINPEATMAKIREYARKGKRDLFVRGGTPISVNYWVIKKAVEKHKRIDNYGNILEIEVQLDLQEYVYDSTDSTKLTTSSVQSTNTTTNSSNKPTGKMKIIVKSVHIRSGPGVNNSVLGYAMNGDELTVYGMENGWYRLGGGKYITANSAYSSFKGAS